MLNPNHQRLRESGRNDGVFIRSKRRTLIIVAIVAIAVLFSTQFAYLNFGALSESFFPPSVLDPMGSGPNISGIKDGNITITHKQQEQQQQQHPHVMFYNIFIPNVVVNGKEEEKAFIHLMESILHEQLNQTNAYLSNNDQVSSGLVKYLLIDSSPGSLFNETRIQTICSQYNHLECEMIGDAPVKEGNEYMTLNKVHEYCKDTEDKSQRVSYFHTKGTYHPGRINVVWRYHLLRAILHPDCINPPVPHVNLTFGAKTCNACGLLFQPVWNTMFPGNFWTVQCSMVQKLLRPEDYEHRLRTIIHKMYNSNEFDANIYGWDGWSLGFGRMAAEFWVASHPDLQPCDLSQEANVLFWVRTYNVTSQFSFATGVRHAPGERRHMMRVRFVPALTANETLRKREYYWLPGLLVRWYALYAKFPPRDSWVWKHYPDGDYWRERVQEPSYIHEFYANIYNQSTVVAAWGQAQEKESHDRRINRDWSGIIRAHQG